MKHFLLFLSVSVLFLSCEDDLPNSPKMYKYVNEWVYGNMDGLYYWNTTLPSFRSTTVNPNDYFETLKNKDDRFSAIFESYQDILNELNGVSDSEIGFDFELFTESAGSSKVVGVVVYVKPGTPAQTMGIKRGDIFRKINGIQITVSNYKTVIDYLFDKSTSTSITFSVSNDGLFADKAAVIINKAPNYKENPIYLDTVYTIQNKKVGYLVYNFFTNDPGDKSMKYDLELNSIIARYKIENISELILDFRYNHGGMMSSAINLASMLVPNLTTNKVFSYTNFNKNYTDYFNSDEFKRKNLENPFINNFATTIAVSSAGTETIPLQNLGSNLQRIFFLTGNGTASASEMVINGLKPFIPCVLIGDTTVGKNVGSTLINDEKNLKNKWAIMPIVLKYSNKDHQSDFASGFVPDFLVEDDYAYELGDTRERLLGKAINEIYGEQLSASKAFSPRVRIQNNYISYKSIRNGLVVKSKSVDSFSKEKNK